MLNIPGHGDSFSISYNTRGKAFLNGFPPAKTPGYQVQTTRTTMPESGNAVRPLPGSEIHIAEPDSEDFLQLHFFRLRHASL